MEVVLFGCEGGSSVVVVVVVEDSGRDVREEGEGVHLRRRGEVARLENRSFRSRS